MIRVVLALLAVVACVSTSRDALAEDKGAARAAVSNALDPDRKPPLPEIPHVVIVKDYALADHFEFATISVGLICCHYATVPNTAWVLLEKKKGAWHVDTIVRKIGWEMNADNIERLGVPPDVAAGLAAGMTAAWKASPRSKRG